MAVRKGPVLLVLTMLGLCVLAGVVTGAAIAQPIQARVVQSGDGSLYLVQGANVWPLVPDPIDDAELATLSLGAEVDGTLPASLLNATAPTQSPAAGQPAPPLPPPDVAVPPPAAPPPPAAVPTRGAASKGSATGATPMPLPTVGAKR
jgi:hypothetical protein